MKPFESLIATKADSPYCVFAYRTPNLGDYVQTLAMLHHVQPASFIFRDHPQPATEKILVANAYMTQGPFPVSTHYRQIVYAGIHLASTHRSPEFVDELKRSAPIGCRDTSTEHFLKQEGVECVLTRCATLTFPEYKGPRSGIHCVDLDEKVFQGVVAAFGKKHQYKNTTHELDWLPETCMEDGSFHQRMKLAYDSLLNYRSASLVVTSRIHVALPSIAFGTPVIYCGPRDARFGAFEGMELGEGWKQFTWYRRLLRPWRGLPRPVNPGNSRTQYLNYLSERLQENHATR